MCMIKVANSGDSGEYFRFKVEETTDEGGGGAEQPPPPPRTQEQAAAAAPQMFTGYSQSREMSAMVTALTHVVSGQRSGELTYYRPEFSGGGMMSFGGGGGAGGSGIYTSNSPSSAYSSSSSGSWAGRKRGREEESSVTQFSEQQFQRVYRGFGDFRGGESSSVSAG